MMEVAGDSSFIVSRRDFLFDSSVKPETKKYYQQELLTLSRLRAARSGFIDSSELSSLAADHPGLNFIGEPTCVMFKRENAIDAGPFDENLSQICDLEYWFRLTTKSGLMYIDSSLASFRIHADSTTSGNVLSKPKFRPRYIDTLILSFRMLYDPKYTAFRTQISSSQRSRLELYFQTRVLEAQEAFKKDENIARDFFERLFISYPGLEEKWKPGFLARFAFSLVKIKRKLK
jgi:hypothetical protein